MAGLIIQSVDKVQAHDGVLISNASENDITDVAGTIFKDRSDSPLKNLERTDLQQHRVADLSTKSVGQPPAQAMAEKSGNCGECIDARDDIYGGKIYIFALRDEYNPARNPKTAKQDFDSKNDELFPAIELTVEDLKNLKLEEYQKEFQELGYKFNLEGDRPTLELPDRDALKMRFEKNLRKMRPDVKPLKLVSSEGIADDSSFIKAYFLYDMLLSTGREFVHDHLAHIIPTLLFMIESPHQYYSEKKRLGGVFEKIDRRFNVIERSVNDGIITNFTKKQLAKLRTILGAAVDVAWSFTIPIPGINLDYFDGKWNHFIKEMASMYKRFWARRFDGEGFDLRDLDKLWKQARDFE